MYSTIPRTPCALSIAVLITGCGTPDFMKRSAHQDAARPETPYSEGLPVQDVATSIREHEDRPALSPAGTLRLDEALRFAVHTHPALRGQAFQVQAAEGRITQSRLYPNPSLAVEAEALGADAGDGGETTFLLEQEFVTGGKLRKARAVAQADRLLSLSRLLEIEFEVATRVRLAFVSALAAEQRLESERELLILADELLSAANSQVEAGVATEPDRLRAEVVREQVAIDLQAAIARATAAHQALGSALGMDDYLELEIEGDLAASPILPSRDETVALVLSNNTRIEQASLAIERAKRAHELSRAESIPSVTASFGPRYSDPDNETSFDVGIGIEIPFFDRNQGEVSATLAERLAAGESLSSVRLELMEAMSEAWSEYESSRYAVEVYQTSLLPKALRTLELTREAYRAGKTDYLRLLDAQQTYVRSRIAAVDALEAIHQAAAVIDGLTQDKTPWRSTDEPNSEGVDQ